MAEPPDTIVIGAGLAGCAIASHLAKRGQRVLIVEKGDLPRDKLCGEFLSTESERLLTELGAWDAIRSAGPATIDGARFVSAKGRTIELELPGRGYGLSRRRLDAILCDRALAAGAELRTKVEVVGATANEVRTKSEAIAGRRIVGAHGRKSRVDLALGRGFAEARHDYLGLKRHHRATAATIQSLQGWVEIHTFDGGYCGVCLVEDNVINVCMLLEGRAIEGPLEWEEVTAALAKKSDSLASRLASLTPIAEMLAVAQVPFTAKEQAKDGVLFVGDAAGVIAPLVGDGQAMALESAAMLASMILEGGPDLPERWPSAWRERFTGRMRISRVLQRQLLDGARAEIVFAGLGLLPGLPSLLARWTRTV